MKTKTLLLTLLVLIPLGTAEITHRIEIKDDSAAEVESNILFKSEEKANYWQSSWNIPENAENFSIEDTEKELDEATLKGNTVTFNTSKGEKRKEELVTIKYTIPEKTEKIAENLHRAEFQLSGLSDEETRVQVKTPEKILGTSESHGFESKFKNRTANFSGNGAVNIRTTWTPREGEYEHFILFDNTKNNTSANLTRADSMYPILNMITGRTTEFRKFAVTIEPDSKYMEEHNSWFAGTYENGGTIFIKASEIEKNSLTGLILHETMHGFNQRPLKWVETDSSVFDEGTAKYVEFLVNHNLGVKQAEIFGESVEWAGTCQDDKTKECSFRINPRGRPEHLWSYYQQDQNLMKRWNPSKTESLGEIDFRTFGYSYGELLVRDKIMESENNSLKNIYSRMKDLKKAETPDTYWDNLAKALKSNMTPCYPNSQKEFETCLKKINSLEPKIPENITIEGEKKSINFQKIERDEVKEKDISDELTKPSPRENFLTRYIKYLKNLISDIFG